MSTNILHSKKTVKWGTPEWLIAHGRQLLDNEIHLDPASSPEFNKLVQAQHIYTEQDNGLERDWLGHVFLNPPGGLVRPFWDRLLFTHSLGYVPKAFWVGFSVEQLCQLTRSAHHPLDFSTCILTKRICFNTENLSAGAAPSHGNYVTGLNVDKDLFDKLFQPLGRVSHGVST